MSRNYSNEATAFGIGVALGITATLIILFAIALFLGSNHIEDNICQDIIVTEKNLDSHYSASLKRTVYTLNINDNEYEISSTYYESLSTWTEYDDMINIIAIIDTKDKEIVAISLAKNMK